MTDEASPPVRISLIRQAHSAIIVAKGHQPVGTIVSANGGGYEARSGDLTVNLEGINGAKGCTVDEVWNKVADLCRAGKLRLSLPVSVAQQ